MLCLAVAAPPASGQEVRRQGFEPLDDERFEVVTQFYDLDADERLTRSVD